MLGDLVLQAFHSRALAMNDGIGVFNLDPRAEEERGASQ